MSRVKSRILPAIPDKRYFTPSEAARLCGIKRHVLTHWEQRFPQLQPLKRDNQHRRYGRAAILLIRRIRQLLYEERLTIRGAREQLSRSTPGNVDSQGTSPLDAYAIAVELDGLLRDLER